MFYFVYTIILLCNCHSVKIYLFIKWKIFFSSKITNKHNTFIIINNKRFNAKLMVLFYKYNII